MRNFHDQMLITVSTKYAFLWEKEGRLMDTEKLLQFIIHRLKVEGE